MEALTVSILDAAKALGIGRTSVYALIKSGQLDVVKIGRRAMIKVDSIRRLIDGAV